MNRIIVMLNLVAASFLFLVPAAQALEEFSRRSIEGDYVAVAIEQGGGTGTRNGALLPEAALITLTCDGEGKCSGTLLWNMPDPMDPTAARLIINKQPHTAVYNVNPEGFGSMKVTADLTTLGMGKITIRLQFLITQATPNKIATEMYYIGRDYLDGGSYPVGFMKLR